MLKRLSSLSLLLFVGSLAFFACSTSDDTGTGLSALSGTWTSSGGDSIVISGTAFTYSYSGTVMFKGTIVNNPDLTQTSGYITLKITDDGAYDSPTLDSYYVIHYKNYTGTTMKESSAYKSGSSYNSGATTQALAEAEFTVANGYFGMYGDYTKQ